MNETIKRNLTEIPKEKMQAIFRDKSNRPLIILSATALIVMLLSILTGILFPQEFHYSKGKALAPGSCIGVTAPAFFVKDNAFQESIDVLEEAGYRVDIVAGQGHEFASLPMAIADYLEKNA